MLATVLRISLNLFLWSAKCCSQLFSVCILGHSGRGLKLNAHFQIVPRLKMGGFVPLIHLDASLILLPLKLRNLSPRDIWMFSINLIQPSGHFMYRPVVTLCTAQWSLYVPHSGHYMYSPVVTICTTSLSLNNSSSCPHSVFMCFVWISEQTAIISVYSIECLVFVNELECVYCAVRPKALHIIYVNLSI
jgi:hypothetical protein